MKNITPKEAGVNTVEISRGDNVIELKLGIDGSTIETYKNGEKKLLDSPFAPPTPPTPEETRYIGELYQGGIIAALWKESGVEKGLIMSLSDVSLTQLQYSSVTTLGLEDADSQIDGSLITSKIVLQGDVSEAGYTCSNYSNGGYTDWYLPAILELYEIYKNRFLLNRVLTNKIDTTKAYWSSTQNNDTLANALDFYYGGISYDIEKSELRNVRAVRRF